ncbi:hypothetical protein SNEBB_005769 [Seison nebaliae]|nr:hypothetical protein SNEBB_005769 [Seison nebaliae]
MNSKVQVPTKLKMEEINEEGKRHLNQFKKLEAAKYEKTDLEGIRNLIVDDVISSNEDINLKEYFKGTYKFFDGNNGILSYPFEMYIPDSLKDITQLLTIGIYFHGGGWCLGSIVTHRYSVMPIAEATNALWISVDYPLAPETPHTEMIVNSIKTVQEVKTNTSFFKSFLPLSKDIPLKFIVGGDSAGGLLTAAISQELEIDACLYIYPSLYIDYDWDRDEYTKHYLKGYALEYEAIQTFLKMFLSRVPTEEWSNVINSPLVSRGLFELKNVHKHPSLFIAASCDPLTGDSIKYHQKLLANNFQSQLHIIKGVLHGYLLRPKLCPKANKETYQIISNFFVEKHLKSL